MRAGHSSDAHGDMDAMRRTAGALYRSVMGFTNLAAHNVEPPEGRLRS